MTMKFDYVFLHLDTAYQCDGRMDRLTVACSSLCSTGWHKTEQLVAVSQNNATILLPAALLNADRFLKSFGHQTW